MSIPEINLTAILVKDAETGYFSAFFPQFPDAIAQGDSEEEALNNLVEVVQFMLDDQKDTQYAERFKSNEIKTEHFKLVYA